MASVNRDDTNRQFYTKGPDSGKKKRRRTRIGTKVLTRDKKPTLEIRSYMRFCCLKNQVLHIELSITPVQFIQVLNPLILHLLTIFICVLITLTVHFKCHFEGELQKAEK